MLMRFGNWLFWFTESWRWRMIRGPLKGLRWWMGEQSSQWDKEHSGDQDDDSDG